MNPVQFGFDFFLHIVVIYYSFPADISENYLV